MILSDRSLREAIDGGRIVVDPYDPGLVQPSSIDVRLDRLFRVFRNHTAGVIDVKQDQTGLTELVEIAEDGVFMLHPGEFVLGSTLERVAVPDDLVGRVEGKSSLGRLGLLIHSTAGFVDAGFDGHITLELANVASLPITLYPGMKIGQISFMTMTTPADGAVRQGRHRLEVPGPTGPHPQPLLRELPPERNPGRSDPTANGHRRAGCGAFPRPPSDARQPSEVVMRFVRCDRSRSKPCW